MAHAAIGLASPMPRDCGCHAQEGAEDITAESLTQVNQMDSALLWGVSQCYGFKFSWLVAKICRHKYFCSLWNDINSTNNYHYILSAILLISGTIRGIRAFVRLNSSTLVLNNWSYTGPKRRPARSRCSFTFSTYLKSFKYLKFILTNNLSSQ